MSKVKRIVRGAARKTGVARAVRGTRAAARKVDRGVFGGEGIMDNLKKAQKAQKTRN